MITIDWLTKIISVPQSYLTFVSGSLYNFDTYQFKKDLKTLEASAAGMVNDDTHEHVTEIVLGGVPYARFIIIINGYQIEFEDTGTPYRVSFQGSNNNIADVTVLNQNVSIQPNNAAGLISPNAWREIVDAANTADGSFGELTINWLQKGFFLGNK